MSYLHRQQGNTVLGFIAGLITGLLVAVIVAMLVTKAAIPFSQKQVKQGKIAEAASAPPVDPNKALYSNASAPKPSASASTPPPPPAPAAQPIQQTTEPARQVTRVEPAAQPLGSGDDPVAEKIRQQSGAPAPQKSDGQADDRWVYMVQTNAYRDPVEAQNERARLALSGFEAIVSETSMGNARLYRVRLGPFPNAEAMNSMINKLADSGINAAPVRIPKK